MIANSSSINVQKYSPEFWIGEAFLREKNYRPLSSTEHFSLSPSSLSFVSVGHSLTLVVSRISLRRWSLFIFSLPPPLSVSYSISFYLSLSPSLFCVSLGPFIGVPISLRFSRCFSVQLSHSLSLGIGTLTA